MVKKGAGKHRAPKQHVHPPKQGGRRWPRFVLIGAGGFVLLILIAQLFYPPDRLLPFVHINGQNFGTQSTWDTIRVLEKTYNEAAIEVRGGEVVARASFEEVGIHPSITPTVQQAGKYSLAQRLIPFSSLFIMFGRDEPLQARVDEERVRYFAEQFEQESARPAQNAAITVQGDKVELVAAKPSQTFPTDAVYEAIIKAPRTPLVTIAPEPQTTQPAITDEMVQATLETAKHIVDAPLTVAIGDTKIAVDKATVASWLDFPVVDGKMELRVKTDAVKQFVESIQPQGYQAPRATRVTIVDGRETGRTVGVAGRGVDLNAATAQIEERIRSGQGGELALTTVALAPGLTYDRQYSDGSAGLISFLVDLVNSKGNYAITVIELGGRNRGASVNGDKVYVAASTYKVFVAYAVFHLIANGEMQWSETVGGMRADACFEDMIVHSDNDCAWALGERVGWSRVQNLIQAAGLTSTTLSADGSTKNTTANDLALFMRKLEEGSLLPAASRDLLISYLKRQVYRNGIPAATGVPVANKVGRYGNFVHDAGIVYSPSGTYIMVIMSSGTWAALTNTARQVHQFVIR